MVSRGGAANRYLAGITEWTGTVNAKYDGWTGDEVFAPRFAERLPFIGLLLSNWAEWQPVEAIESREPDVQHMDHDDLNLVAAESHEENRVVVGREGSRIRRQDGRAMGWKNLWQRRPGHIEQAMRRWCG